MSENGMEIITASRIGDFKNCRKNDYYRNVMKLALRIEKAYRKMGSSFHLGLETCSVEDALALYADVFPSDQAGMDALEIEKATVHAMLEGYWNEYGPDGLRGWNVLDTRDEVQFEIPIINPETGATSRSFRLGGKVDKLVQTPEGWWLFERKTASQVGKSYIDKLALDAQVTTYVYAAQRAFDIKIVGIVYDMVRKPSIKVKQGESVPQYIERLIADYKDPTHGGDKPDRAGFYFFREKLYRSQEDLAEFEAELWQFTQDLLYCRRTGLWFKNPSRCLDWGGCAYMPLCLQRPDAMDLYRIAEPNEELEEEAA